MSGANIIKYVCATHNLSVKIMAKNRFREHYDALPPKAPKAPKSAFVDEIADLCKVHPATVRCWIYGTQKPDALRRSLIAKHLNIPENELFD